jgi:SAM-dependent methyltransferase
MQPEPLDQSSITASRFYNFGLKVGFANLWRNRFRLGVQKTLGKILQPVNSYTRFPEYEFMGKHLDERIRSRGEERLRILDVGSPKLFGLWLASNYDVEVHLTDIDKDTLREAASLWRAIQDKAMGQVFFQKSDARTLGYNDREFDLVYSMSVIEHVAGDGADKQAILEMERVLKPGGSLLISTPLGPHYVEQQRKNLAGSARKTNDGEYYFFQRIYDSAHIRELVSVISDGRMGEIGTVHRRSTPWLERYQSLGEKGQALLGWLNPRFSKLWNKAGRGMSFTSCTGSYNSIFSPRDLYGDVMFVWEKPGCASVAE